MLFSLRSTVLFSSAIAASVLDEGVAVVPVPAAPVVTPGAAFEPEDWAVPALFVPGGGEPTVLPADRPLPVPGALRQ